MSSVQRLIQTLRALPGVGPKSAQRMVYHLLQHNRVGGLKLAEALQFAMENVIRCTRCQNFSDEALCTLCKNPNRDRSILCIVESPSDIAAIESTHSFTGCYFILMGKISPLDGLGPKDIGLPNLKKLIEDDNIQEVILALSPTIEGQTTMHYIQDLLASRPITLTQLAHGIPSGSDLDCLDGHTISVAFHHRQILSSTI